ncbi:MBL fold metallo-hydrolase [Ekhidna sp. MALMAid0563]|uniref:MBL fold metallo-hydrolase n=1 Tax=Ekhidna sp. MALMAid0563 TaxID=3143937 RepID=UPI0032DF538E
MELTVLGCGDAFGNGGRNNTSFLLTEGDESILLDCGASTLIRLKHEKVDLESISTIVISHFHGDHFGGIPFFLISSMFENPRKKPLTIVGPEGVSKRVYDLQEAMYAGTAAKTLEMDLTYHEYKEGEPLILGEKTINAWKAEHSLPSIPHCIRVEWKGKTIAFSGDTSWTDNLIPLADGSDLFICECNFLDKVSFGHLGYSELLEKQTLFNTKQMWLTHMADEVIESSDSSFNKLADGLKIII